MFHILLQVHQHLLKVSVNGVYRISPSRNNVQWAKGSGSPELPFQQYVLTDVQLDLPSELSGA